MSDVSMVYDNGVRAVKRATLRIDEGEFVFLVGPSGSGKSTLIKLLTGEVRPSSGRIVVNNYNMSTIKKREIPYLRRTLGVVFQDFRLIEKKTVYENVAFAMRAVGAKNRAIKKRVPYVLELVGLSDKADTRPLELSGGEQQRVAIARALVNNPRLIIADEPTGNLDPVRSYELMTLFEKINELGTTILIVTHEKELVDEFEKRVIMIDDGVIVSDATGRYFADDEFYEDGEYEQDEYDDNYDEQAYREDAQQAEAQPSAPTPKPESSGVNVPLAMLFDRFTLKKTEQAEQAAETAQDESEEIVQALPADEPEMPQSASEPQDEGAQTERSTEIEQVSDSVPETEAESETEVEEPTLTIDVQEISEAAETEAEAEVDTAEMQVEVTEATVPIPEIPAQEQAEPETEPTDGDAEIPDDVELDLKALDDLVNRFQERLGWYAGSSEQMDKTNENHDGDSEDEQENEETETPEQ